MASQTLSNDFGCCVFLSKNTDWGISTENGGGLELGLVVGVNGVNGVNGGVNGNRDADRRVLPLLLLLLLLPADS